MRETWVQSLGREEPLEKGTATHSSILAWRIPRTEEPGGLLSMGSQGVGHDWATFTFTRMVKEGTCGMRSARAGTPRWRQVWGEPVLEANRPGSYRRNHVSYVHSSADGGTWRRSGLGWGILAQAAVAGEGQEIQGGRGWLGLKCSVLGM